VLSGTNFGIGILKLSKTPHTVDPEMSADIGNWAVVPSSSFLTSFKKAAHPIPEATALLPRRFAIQMSDASLMLKTPAHFDLLLRPLAAPYDRPVSDKVV
jgi:hypothetical protein